MYVRTYTHYRDSQKWMGSQFLSKTRPVCTSSSRASAGCKALNAWTTEAFVSYTAVIEFIL